MEINLSSGAFEVLERSALEDYLNPLRKLILGISTFYFNPKLFP